MKHLHRSIFVFMLFVLLGAGCSTPEPVVVDQAPVGEWFLTFDNGEVWYPHWQYWAADVAFEDLVFPSYKRTENRIWLQNVNAPINPEYISQYKEDYDYYEGDDWVLVDATVYPKPGASFPDSGVELTTIGDHTFATRVSGGRNVYYWETDAHVYELFVVTAKGNDVGAEELLATIREVEGVSVAE